MTTQSKNRLTTVPNGDRVLKQTLSEARLRFIRSIEGKFAAAWRTYSPGNPHPDDGKLWLLERVGENEYIARYERSVFYANQVAVSDNGLIAWIRAEGHKAPGRDLEIIDSEGEYIIESVRLHAAAETITFSTSGDTIATLLSNAAPTDQRAFAWNTKNGRNVAAFPLLLTGGKSTLNITDDTYGLITCDGTYVEHTFDGSIISDSRFDKIVGYNYLWWLHGTVNELPTDQLCYALEALNTLIRTNAFAFAKKSDRDSVKSLRNKILRMLGEAEIDDTSLNLNIQGDLYGRLSDCVASGLFGNDAETVAVNLLSRALDFVQAK